ncbi:MAG: nicotinamide-nucleotide amidohydrolase family protein [bacterium]|nr:nicotinamide-nucleotide amidohydrolase family protein [bacterium]
MTRRPVRIVTVGDELLEGRTVDTNSGRIQRALAGREAPVLGVSVVPDEAAAIATALDATAAGDLVFLTGGLGSTPDDLTREAVAAWAGVDLEQDAELASRLERRWRARGINLKPSFLKQSDVPAGLEPVDNPQGSAPGLVGDLRDRTLVVLPGVPGEMAALLPLVLERLDARGVLPPAAESCLWRTAQVAEVTLVEACASVRDRWPGLRWSWWLTEWGADVRVAASPAAAAGDLAAAAAEVDRILDGIVFARERRTLPEAVLELLIARGRTVSTAESCTAGLVAGRLTDPAGSSAAFRGAVVAYADEVKTARLGVPAELIAAHGAVSREVVLAMAAGARERFGTDHALALSGISGPGGGTDAKPVGTTWIALDGPGGAHARRYRFPADRSHNRRLAVAAALDALRRVLEAGDDVSPWHQVDSWRGDR